MEESSPCSDINKLFLVKSFSNSSSCGFFLVASASHTPVGNRHHKNKSTSNIGQFVPMISRGRCEIGTHADKHTLCFSIYQSLPSHRAEAEPLITVMNNVTGCLITQSCPAWATWARINVICTWDITPRCLFQSNALKLWCGMIAKHAGTLNSRL